MQDRYMMTRQNCLWMLTKRLPCVLGRLKARCQMEDCEEPHRKEKCICRIQWLRRIRHGIALDVQCRDGDAQVQRDRHFMTCLNLQACQLELGQPFWL